MDIISVEFNIGSNVKGGEFIKINVRFNGLIGASLGYKEKLFEISEGMTIKELLEMIVLPVKSNWTFVSVNGVIKDKKTVLEDGDKLVILPICGGG